MKLELFNLARKIHAINHHAGGIDSISIEGLLGQHKIPLINKAAGILPVATIWDTVPTSLENTTDDNWSTHTGTGQKILGAAGDVGHLTLTLPTYSAYLVFAILSLWSSASQLSVRAYSLLDGSTQSYSGINIMTKTITTETLAVTIPAIIVGTSFRLTVYANGACTANAKFYEIFAFDLFNF